VASVVIGFGKLTARCGVAVVNVLGMRLSEAALILRAIPRKLCFFGFSAGMQSLVFFTDVRLALPLSVSKQLPE
jgi:hypothetical protein